MANYFLMQYCNRKTGDKRKKKCDRHKEKSDNQHVFGFYT